MDLLETILIAEDTPLRLLSEMREYEDANVITKENADAITQYRGGTHREFPFLTEIIGKLLDLAFDRNAYEKCAKYLEQFERLARPFSHLTLNAALEIMTNDYCLYAYSRRCAHPVATKIFTDIFKILFDALDPSIQTKLLHIGPFFCNFNCDLLCDTPDEVARFLIAKGYDVDAIGCHVDLSPRYGDIESIYPMTSFFCAVVAQSHESKMQKIRLLLEHHANINMLLDGTTVLHIAVQVFDATFGVVRLLLDDPRVRIDIRDSCGKLAEQYSFPYADVKDCSGEFTRFRMRVFLRAMFNASSPAHEFAQEHGHLSRYIAILLRGDEDDDYEPP